MSKFDNNKFDTRSTDSLELAYTVNSKYAHDPSLVKVLVIGKGGFSSSPLIIHGYLKDFGYNGTACNLVYRFQWN